MKTILTACGVGYASSTIIAERVKDLLARNGLTDEVRILQCTLNEVPGMLEDVDCVVTSSMVTGEFSVPMFNGVAFLSGIGMEELEEKILEVLKK